MHGGASLKAIHELTGGQGAECTMDCTGNPDARIAALRSADTWGRVALVGEGPFEDVDLWGLWDAIACPVLVLRGAESDLLLPETAQEMARRGPKARVVEIAGCGHAPGLMDDRQTALVRDWLLMAES